MARPVSASSGMRPVPSRDHADENGEREGEGKTESHRQLVSS